jgi:hypothetical protein
LFGFEDASEAAAPPHVPLCAQLYSQPTTDEVIASLHSAVDFRDWFFDFPLGYIAFFDHAPLGFDPTAVILEAKTWATRRRTEFLSALFDHINSIGFIYREIHSLINCEMQPLLLESIEGGRSTARASHSYYTIGRPRNCSWRNRVSRYGGASTSASYMAP